MKKRHNNKNRLIIISIFSVLVLIFAAFAVKSKFASSFNAAKNSAENSDNKNNTDIKANAVVKDNDIVIPIKNVTEKASFYPAVINGTKLEVIAVKAPDGTIRTAFNTCQVCYNSGKGFYKQEGNELVCQNCGNRFTMDQVEQTKGGCNPVPLTDDYKSVSKEKITIKKDVLIQATSIFSNWGK